MLSSVTIHLYIFFIHNPILDLAAAWENVGEAKSAVSIVIRACFVWFQSYRQMVDWAIRELLEDESLYKLLRPIDNASVVENLFVIVLKSFPT